MANMLLMLILYLSDFIKESKEVERSRKESEIANKRVSVLVRLGQTGARIQSSGFFDNNS
jgi:hypothetical protein